MKIGVKVKEAIVEAAAMVGCDGYGTGKLHGYLYALAIEKPEIFGRLLERVMPLSLSGKVDVEHGPKQYETVEELAEALRARGLPMPNRLIDVTPKGERSVV